MKFLLVFLFPIVVAAMPQHYITQPWDGKYYLKFEACPAPCYSVVDVGGIFHPQDELKLVDDKLVDDPIKIEAKQTAAATVVAEKEAKESEKAELKSQVSNLTSKIKAGKLTDAERDEALAALLKSIQSME